MAVAKRKRSKTARSVHDEGRRLFVALDIMRLAMELLPGTPSEFDEFARDYREMREQLALRIARCKRLPVSRATKRLLRLLKEMEQEFAELEVRSRRFQQGATARLHH